MCEDFEILRFFSLCVGPLCLGTLRFYAFLPVCAAPVCGVFEILRFCLPVCGAPVCMGTLRFYGFEILRDFEILRFSPVCGPCVGDFENFQNKTIGKNPGCGDLKWQ